MAFFRSKTTPSLPTFLDDISLKLDSNLFTFKPSVGEWSSKISGIRSNVDDISTLQKQRDFLIEELAITQLDVQQLLSLLASHNISINDESIC
ncbi:hypothetical protein RCL1_003405 [Eukaryota sp. TZLM3-RCL]